MSLFTFSLQSIGHFFCSGDTKLLLSICLFYDILQVSCSTWILIACVCLVGFGRGFFVTNNMFYLNMQITHNIFNSLRFITHVSKSIVDEAKLKDNLIITPCIGQVGFIEIDGHQFSMHLLDLLYLFIYLLHEEPQPSFSALLYMLYIYIDRLHIFIIMIRTMYICPSVILHIKINLPDHSNYIYIY